MVELWPRRKKLISINVKLFTHLQLHGYYGYFRRNLDNLLITKDNFEMIMVINLNIRQKIMHRNVDNNKVQSIRTSKIHKKMVVHFSQDIKRISLEMPYSKVKSNQTMFFFF